MADLTNSTMRLIAAALTGRRISIPQVSTTFIDNIRDTAKKIYSNSKDGRSHEDVYLSCFWGELGEEAILQQLLSCYVLCEHNIEEVTGEYHWDLLIDNMLKGEIKSQSATDNKEFFSFRDKSHDALMRQKWKSFDFIVSFYVENGLVIPWLLISSEVIDPSKDYYVKSKFNSGYYLKTNKAINDGYALRLNPNPK